MDISIESAERIVSEILPELPHALAEGAVAQPRARHDLPPQRLDLPAITARFDQLAYSCGVALRDVYGTSAPEQLSYTAWREPEVMHSGRTCTDEERSSLDAGQNPLPVESLTVPMARR